MHCTYLIEITDKMQPCRTICNSIVPWLLNMFREISLRHDSGRQRQTCVKPEAVITVYKLLMKSNNIAQNM
jgi:hypothetical protein